MSTGDRWRNAWTLALCLLLAGLASFASHAQSTERTIRLGVLFSGSTGQWAYLDAALLTGLRDQGYVEGRNLVVVRRYWEFQTAARLKSSAAELAALKLDAIVTTCNMTTRAAMDATGSTPIVMAVVSDPVGRGLVKSLARPGGNVTGRSAQLADLEPKQLQLLRAVVPDGARIAVLLNSRNPVHESQWREMAAAARALNMNPVRVEVRGFAGLDAALDSLAKSDVRGLMILSDDALTIEGRDRIIAAAARLRLPSVSGFPAYAEDGGLMAYGEDTAEGFRRSAAYVVKVANGANPAELPIEQPTRFELVINLKTAAALGITIPRELLARADRTIE